MLLGSSTKFQGANQHPLFCIGKRLTATSCLKLPRRLIFTCVSSSWAYLSVKNEERTLSGLSRPLPHGTRLIVFGVGECQAADVASLERVKQ